jgi:hypothetical protein
MKALTRFLVVLVFLGCAGTANAVLIEGKNWLQLTTVTNYSWDQFDAIFDTTTGQCDVAGCLLGGTVDLTGYVWANNADVDTMLSAFFGVSGLSSLTSDGNRTTGVDAGDALLELLDPTSTDADTEDLVGWTRDSSGGAGLGDWMRSRAFIGSSDGANDNYDLEIHSNAASDALWRGAWLYRDVPTPTTFALFAIGLAGLGWSRRKKV